MVAQIIITIGLICDFVGAILVAIEVVKVFKEPTTIDIGDTGSINGGFISAPNPKYVKYEKMKHHYMKIGLSFLLLGFALQGLGTWWPVIVPYLHIFVIHTPCSLILKP